jgi:hypothetical protein
MLSVAMLSVIILNVVVPYKTVLQRSLTNPVNFNSHHHTFLEVIDSIESTYCDSFTTAILT